MKRDGHKKIDSDTAKAIADWAVEKVREEEMSLIERRHDSQRANIKLLLQNFRDIIKYAEEAVSDALQVDDDLKLRDLLEMMENRRGKTFTVESIKESAATARLIANHMGKMLESFKHSCEKGKEEDRRRYRVLAAMYVDDERKTADEIAESENIDRSTVYRDIDAAAEKLAILFFGVYGLKFL